MECGAPLAEQEPAPRRRSRKVVTILFSDVTGFTPLSERTDSEALHAVMDRYVNAMTKVIERHEGRVERFIGDAVMATFGLPAVREDDALRAVRAAVEIGAALQEVNAKLPPGLEIELSASTGINSGEIFIEEDLASGKQVGELVGDAINVAARLESAAESGQVLLGERTYQLTRSSLEAERLELTLKGKKDKVTAYRLSELAPASAQPDRRLRARTVGRTKEAARLAEAFEQACAEKRCVLASVLGLAGKGKSRLIADALRTLGDSASVLSGRCLPYGEATIYWPLAEITCQAAQIRQDEQPPQALAAISKLLSADPDEAQLATAQRLAGAFGLGPLAGAAEEIAPDVVTLMRALASAGPLVVVIEDIHWAAPGLLSALEHLAARLSDAPLLLLCSARPELCEKRPEWPGQAPAAHAIELGALDDRDCAALIAALLEGSAAADELTAPVVAVAGGNPLVVEEVLAMLIDDGVLTRTAQGWHLEREVEEIRIPPTIEAILGARLDRLSEHEREVVEAAAIVGKDFDLSDVRPLCELQGEALDEALAALISKQLIEAAVGTLSDYRFHHILVRDAAYAATPKRRRADLHESFAEHLERSPAGQGGGAYGEIVGEHLERSCLLRRELGAGDEEIAQLAHHAGELLEEAGRRALGLSDIPAARRIYARGEAVLARDDPLRAALLTGLAETTINVGLQRDGLSIAHEAVRLATGAARLTAMLARVRAEVYCEHVLLDDALPQLQELVAELETVGDDHSILWGWMTLADVAGYAARFTQAWIAASRGVERAKRSDPGALPYCLVGMCALVSRSPLPSADALALCEEALTLVQPDTLHAAMIEARGLGVAAAMGGDMDGARKRFAAATDVCARYGANVFGHLCLLDWATCEVLAGTFDNAEVCALRGIELCASLDDLIRSEAVSCHALALAGLHRYEEGLAQALTAIDQASANNIEVLTWGHVAAARCLVGMEQLGPAERHAREVLSIARATEAPLHLGWALSCLGEVLLARGQTGDGSAMLREAIDLFDRKGIALASVATRELLGAGPSMAPASEVG
jgi:class 3 adenylate cyclase